jgi:hypothetical protein
MALRRSNGDHSTNRIDANEVHVPMIDAGSSRDSMPLPLWTRGGPAYVYVFACDSEDLLKLGFTRDLLSRLHALHPRWFEFFDASRSLAVEVENVHDARRLERELAARLRPHRAPMPLTINRAAGGDTEWYRGAFGSLAHRAVELGESGFVVHHSLSPLLRDALDARGSELLEWCARLDPAELEFPDARATTAQRRCADHLDAYVAFGLRLERWLPAGILSWHRRASGLGA